MSNENTLRKSRIQESLGSIFHSWEDQEAKAQDFNLIIESGDDLGVVRNLGRKGSRYAPRVILNHLKKFSLPAKNPKILTYQAQSSLDDFNARQNENAKLITHALEKHPNKVVHLGGGHDHIYPLLKAIDKKNIKINILNIDAHLDTRVDPIAHSGTPFRQFLNEAKSNFKIFQTGIHEFANSKSTKSDLGPNISVQTFKDLSGETHFFTKKSQSISHFIHQECDYLIISLDADAIDASAMEAVSAVNPAGIPVSFVNQILSEIKGTTAKTVFGIYEYNPLFDNLSSKGAKTLSYLINNYLE